MGNLPYNMQVKYEASVKMNNKFELALSEAQFRSIGGGNTSTGVWMQTD